WPWASGRSASQSTRTSPRSVHAAAHEASKLGTSTPSSGSGTRRVARLRPSRSNRAVREHSSSTRSSDAFASSSRPCVISRFASCEAAITELSELEMACTMEPRIWSRLSTGACPDGDAWTDVCTAPPPADESCVSISPPRCGLRRCPTMTSIAFISSLSVQPFHDHARARCQHLDAAMHVVVGDGAGNAKPYVLHLRPALIGRQPEGTGIIALSRQPDRAGVIALPGHVQPEFQHVVDVRHATQGGEHRADSRFVATQAQRYGFWHDDNSSMLRCRGGRNGLRACSIATDQCGQATDLSNTRVESVSSASATLLRETKPTRRLLRLTTGNLRISSSAMLDATSSSSWSSKQYFTPSVITSRTRVPGSMPSATARIARSRSVNMPMSLSSLCTATLPTSFSRI